MTARENRRTSAPGRRTRTGRTPARGRTSVVALVVVALTAAVIALAGTTSRGNGAPAQTYKRVQLEQRTFSCAGGIEGATAAHGDVSSGLADPEPIGQEPRQYDVDDATALESFAGQESRSKDWLAWLPCPEPRPRWWFVGAGAATVSHDTVLTVSNPRVGQADIDIDVYGANGPVKAPGLHGITIPAGTTRTVDLAKLAPAVGDLAVSVVATRGLVAISAADRFAPGFVGKAAQEWLPAQATPARVVTLAGLPAKPDKATLVLANPRQEEAIVSVEVIGATGTFAPKDNPTVTVPPGSVVTVPLRSVLDGEPEALRVSSPQPVTAAVRTVTGGDVAFATSVGPVQGTTAFAVPQGSAQLVLSSVGRPTSVRVTAFDRGGKQLQDRSVSVAKAASTAVGLPAATAYVRLVATTPDAVAGFSVTDAAGVATAGVVPSIRSVLLPVVRPAW